MMLDTPKFHEKRTLRTTNSFAGINHSPAACDGEIFDGKNISFSRFPAVSAAQKRYKISSVANGSVYSSLGADNALFCSAGTNFIYDGQIKGSLTVGKKAFGALNNTVTIFPDMKYYSHGIKSYRYCSQSMIPCTDEQQFDTTVMLSGIGEELPLSGNEGDLFFREDSIYLYKYTSGAWESIGSPDPLTKYTLEVDEFGDMDETYTWNMLSNGLYEIETVGSNGGEGNTHLRISFSRDGAPKKQNFGMLKIGDVVSIKGTEMFDSDDTLAVKGLADGTVITDIGTAYITVKNTVGVTSFYGKQSGSFPILEIKRMVPRLSCVTRAGNRLWGAYKNKIYACAPDQPLQWGCEQGINGALTLSPSISEDIIACTQLDGLPVFFTESHIIKVLKVYNGYKLSVISAPSVSKQCIHSLACASGAIYYVSSCGIMRYDGGFPKKLDCGLNIKFKDLVGGSDGVNYYISDSASTFIYDPIKNTWSKESGGFYSFAQLGSDIYGMCRLYSLCYIVLLGRLGCEVPDDIQASGYSPGGCEIYFAPFYENTCEKKTFTRLYLTMRASAQSTTSVYASFDGKDYEFVGSVSGTGKITRSELTMIPNRADYMKLHILTSAEEFELISLTREFVTHSGYCQGG